MQPRKLNILFAFFCYGGNGGIATCNPFLRGWFAETLLALKQDPRIGEIRDMTYSDTPITMTRNRSVVDARKYGSDVLIMIDSDNVPDLYKHERGGAKPFVQSSYDFLYKHYDRGPVVLAAPYCGPPPEELVYIFEWTNNESHHPNLDCALKMVSRTDAAKRTGIAEAGALPTGISMWDVRAFELTEPKKKGDKPWFDYEWGDIYGSEKGSTEDVFATREISLAGLVKLGYNPLFCNWDAWGGHVKQKMVGPPAVPMASDVCQVFADAVRRAETAGERTVMAGHDDPNWNPAEHPLMPERVWDELVVARHGRRIQRLGFCAPDGEYDALSRLVSDRCGPMKKLLLVEVGSWVGESAIAMLRNVWCESNIFCVDPFTGNPKDDSSKALVYFGADRIRRTFKENLAPEYEQKRVTLLDVKSLDAVHSFEEETIDFVYIDAQHEYEDVKADIEAWVHKVREGGTIAGHDYCNAFPGVIKAVDEIFGDYVNVLPDARIWWVDVSAWRHNAKIVIASNGHTEEEPCLSTPKN